MAWLGPVVPFSGYTLENLQVTTTFLFASAVALLSGWGIIYVFRGWRRADWIKLMVLYTFSFLGLLTFRTAATAAYINYDTAKEFLVYAHAASGPKEILAQVEEISRRLTRGLDIQVAYDNDASTPTGGISGIIPTSAILQIILRGICAMCPSSLRGTVPIGANWMRLPKVSLFSLSICAYGGPCRITTT